MCGIVGVYRYKTRRTVESSEIRTMCGLIPYRGPDGQGLHTAGDYGVGHRRLSIIDVSDRSLQPMHTADGQWNISFNGEVYNYLELKQELAAEGCQFSTTSDTEVLLAAFSRWGLHSLERLNGMYAFAVWHQPTRTLTLVRDRLGIKPLYYTLTAEGLAFASEIKCLLTLPEVKCQANLRILDGYMGVGYCLGEETLFKGIYRLPPGHYLQISNGVVDKAAYWDIEFQRDQDLGEAHYVEQAQKLLEDAVRLQLRSDVPLGVFLSGGVDSSAVVAMMRRLGVDKIKTFSVSWDYGPEYDEGRYAREIAALFRTEHHEYRVTPDDFLAFLPNYIWHMDEPVQEAASIALYYIAKKAQDEVTVVLSGEGSDEVFGGYPVYRYMAWLERYRAVPQRLRNGINPLLSRCGPKWNKHVKLSSLSLERRYAGVSLNEIDRMRSLYTPRLLEETQGHAIEQLVAPYYGKTAAHDAQTRMQYLDVKSWLVDDLLIKADRMSMAASLELRVPFLDHRLIEFAARMPSKYRLKGGEAKYLIKKAVEPYLPRHIIYRKKQGFPTPLSLLFKGPLRHYVRDVLVSDRCSGRGLFKPAAIQQLVDEHGRGAADHHKALWQLLVLELWHRVFVDGESLEGLRNAASALAA
ncbi:MAG TPA: asparagine synthase (glutamine-hydrolyzing) [Pirellulales bacterium]|nr:asparagine synthase (glutamine-hydrolyzing) [Pirellulales bacterium]